MGATYANAALADGGEYRKAKLLSKYAPLSPAFLKLLMASSYSSALTIWLDQAEQKEDQGRSD